MEPEAFEDANGQARYDAVAGHVDRILCGDCTMDGQATLEKTTTAWEVMHYLAMQFHDEAESAMRGRSSSDMDPASGPLLEPFVAYLNAIAPLQSYTPQLFSIGVPDDSELKLTLETRLCAHVKKDLCPPRRADGRCWIRVDVKATQSFLTTLLIELFTRAEADPEGCGHDQQLWGLGLVDLASGYVQPAVMDVKVGFLRYNRNTPAAKVAKINGKDEGTSVRQWGLRIGGFRRYVHDGEGATEASDGATVVPAVERHGKPFGRMPMSRTLFSSNLQAFFSTTGFLATRNESGCVAGGIAGTVQFVGREHVRRTSGELVRLNAARDMVEKLLHHVKNSETGTALLSIIALVSTSLLFVYDAADLSGRRCEVKLIDLAMSSFRRLNYSEDHVGFVRGLENLHKFLCE